jgi:ATP-dependent Clp protease ATP-binding subunit ClpA
MPLEPPPDETLSWAESIPESARELLVVRAPLFDCFLSFLIEAEPIFDGLFGHLVRPAEQTVSRLQAAHACAAVVADSLRQTLIGQSDAILALTRMAFARSLRQGQQTFPSTALFLGPPGVGKTFAARQFAVGLAAGSLATGEVPVLELDMTQYAQWSSTGDLFGEGQKVGCVTSFVNDNPECVLILNEMEKGHRKVLEAFLPILDQGILSTGNKSKRVDFRQAILVFTTNLGAEFWDRSVMPESGSLQVDPLDLLSLAERPDERSEWFKTPVPKELLSRLGKGAIVLFRRAQGHHLMSKIKGSFPLVEVR